MQDIKKDNNMCKTYFIRQTKKDLIVLQIPYIGVSSFSLWRQLATLWEFNFFLVSKVKPITKFLIYTRKRQNRPKEWRVGSVFASQFTVDFETLLQAQ